jgi:uncharacterized membrane protein (DUF106 family)
MWRLTWEAGSDKLGPVHTQNFLACPLFPYQQKEVSAMSRPTRFILVCLVCLLIGFLIGYQVSNQISNRKIENLQVQIRNLKDSEKANSRYLDTLEQERDRLRKERDEAIRERDIAVQTLVAIFKKL